MDAEPIVIEPEDIASHLSEHHEITEKTGVLLDANRGIWVDLGVPILTESEKTTGFIDPPNNPHVFRCMTCG